MKVKGREIDMKFLGKVGNYIRDNGSTFAMIGSIVTLGMALYSAFKASKDVSDINEDYDAEVVNIENKGYSDDRKAKEIKDLKVNRNIKYVLAYKWALTFGGIAAGLIFLTKYLDGLTISGLTALAVANQEKLKSAIENAKKLMSDEQAEKFEELTLEDKVLRNFIGENGELKGFKVQNISKYAHGEIFVDTQDGYIFQIDRDDLIECLEWSKNYWARNHGISKEKHFSHMGIEHSGNRYEEWGPDNPFEATIGRRDILGMNVSTIEYKTNPRVVRKN